MPTVSLDDDAPIADAATPELHLLQRADVESLRRAIENLPVEFREVLLMSDVEEMSYKEIARHLPTILAEPIAEGLDLSRAMVFGVFSGSLLL